MNWKIFLACAVVLVITLIIAIATRPDDFRIERSTTMHATADLVLARINNLHDWSLWSPYEKLDREMHKVYTGPISGVGAAYAWSGKKSGEGSMKITAAEPQRTSIALEFTKPMAASNVAEFLVTPMGDDVKVTWTMSGKTSIPAKAFGLFVNVDKMVGKDFEDGLAMLKTIAEHDTARRPPIGSASAPAVQ